MKVILKEQVSNLGEIGDVVTVKNGYARNYLFPQSMALRATQSNLEEVEARKAELLKKQAEKRAALSARAEKIAGAKIQISAQVKDGEKELFGSISATAVAQALSDQGHEVGANEVMMPNGSIKVVGTHDITLLFGSDIRCDITLEVVAEDSE